jgi:hypothetical protein
MLNTDIVAANLQGMYRDVLRDSAGHMRWDRGWQKNAIVTDCRRLLAGFMRGAPTGALGIRGLQVGTGLAAWDQPPGPPPASSGQASLVDPHPFTVPVADLKIDFLALTSDTVSADPTNRLQIVASLGPGVPSWPDANHTTSTLREFGLVGALDGATLLINYVTHPAIVKDPTSTLERTIWLVF